jgi:hypothetical protein
VAEGVSRVGRRREKDPRHALSQDRGSLLVPRSALPDGENVATRGRLTGLVDKGLRPNHIIIFQETDFRGAILDQLPGGVLNRSEGAACQSPGTPLTKTTRELRALSGTVHITKVAAASRQLDAAIRMFFAKEDELAIHTIASAAFRILRDLIKGRGRNLTAEMLQNFFYTTAREYAEGKLPKEKLKLLENTALMRVITDILEAERAAGGKFDAGHILIRPSPKGAIEKRLWPSKAPNFLKHAHRDAETHLAADEIENENDLIGACAAYLALMGTPSPEIMAFYAFWAVKHDAEVGGEVRELALKLRSIEEPVRHRVCAKFIQKRHRRSGLRRSVSV